MVHKNLIYATTIVICTVLLLQSCNKKQNDLLFEIPDNSIKSIETRYYEPLFLNGKWITGDEIEDIYICPKIEYFDEFNNILLEKEIRDSINQGYDNFYTRTFYFDPQAGKMSKQVKVRADSEMNNFGIKEYKRDSLGRLISVKVTGDGKLGVVWWNNYCPESISYDSEGNKTEKQDNLTTITKKIHSDADMTVYMKQVIDENNSYKYRGVYGLIEYEIITTDTKTGNTNMKLIENTQYGELSGKSMTCYKYNNNGKLIKKEIFKIETPTFFKVPYDLSPEEEKEYIKENYFGSNIEYTCCYEEFQREYNSNNDLIYESYIKNPYISIDEFPTEFNIQDYTYYITKQTTNIISQSSKTYYEYVYNEKNDWIKRTKYHRVQDMSPLARSVNKGKPDQQVEEIIIRKIDYFD